MNTAVLNEWQQLKIQQKQIAPQHMRELFKQEPLRFQHYSIKTSDILFDYSRNRIDQATMHLLYQLLDSVNLKSKIEDLFAGKPINSTENRSVLHTALRDLAHQPIYLNGINIAEQIKETQKRLDQFVADIHQGTRRGITCKPFKHIVNIGIGGSYLGPKMAVHALKDYAISQLSFDFISTVDADLVDDTLSHLDLAQTLFIVSSKTFTTIETMTNMNTVIAKMKAKFGPAIMQQHFVAVTAAPDKALAIGIPESNIFPMWDFVGGRYSVWSAIGLPLMLMLGIKQFKDFLTGAYEIDHHFQTQDYAKNIPVVMALLSVWYLNFFAAEAQAIIPYSHRLRYFIPYLQQVNMESNGKSVRLDGEQVTYRTGPIVFGEEGCNGQHAYHQLLHQGTHLVPVDFILIANPVKEHPTHDDVLLASGLSQAQALMQGKTYEEAYQELIAKNIAPDKAKSLAKHRMMPGNRPSNILCLKTLSPKTLGALMAIYEHKIFVEGVIWGMNSFDQWGVELGKQLLPGILQKIQNEQNATSDSSLNGVLNYIKSLRV